MPNIILRCRRFHLCRELAPVVPRTAGVPENFITPHNFAKDNESSQKIYNDLFR